MAFVVALFASMPVNAQEPKDSATVYVCTGSAAYAYHTHRDCQGLNRCTASIIKTTAAKARKEKRKFCGYCRKRTLPIHKEGEQVTNTEEIM